MLTADKLVQKFAKNSAVQKRIEAEAGGQLTRFYRPVSGYVITQKDGKKFRAFAAEILGGHAPALIAACRALDKFGIPKSDIKLEWKAAGPDDGGEEAAE